MTPILVYAGIISFLGKIFASEKENSFIAEFTVQNIPLLDNPKTPDLRMGRGGGDITIVGQSAILSASGPLGSIVEVEAEDRRSSRISIYVVRQGDTLSSIAKMFDVNVNTIVWANDLRRGSVIQEGQVLTILPVSGIRYTVKKGDTVASVAAKFKGDADEILQYNDLIVGTTLIAGQVIIVPNGEIIETQPSIPSGSRTAVSGSGPEYAGYYLRPIAGGRRTQGIHGYNGVDLANTCGSPIFASASGDVIVARSSAWNGGYGKYLVINHSNGTQTLYAHVSSMIVGVGWHVLQGQIVGYIGTTGLSTGCHVHFEIRGARNPF